MLITEQKPLLNIINTELFFGSWGSVMNANGVKALSYCKITNRVFQSPNYLWNGGHGMILTEFQNATIIRSRCEPRTALLGWDESHFPRQTVLSTLKLFSYYSPMHLKFAFYCSRPEEVL